jgi:uncharacterized delta-60 repeat protein
MTRRKKTKGSKSPLIRLVGLEAAAVAAAATAGMVGSPAMGAPGDLDPSFGDVGRRSSLDLTGPVWSVEVEDDDAILFAGGEIYCYYDCYDFDFTGRLLADGSIDAGFVAATLENTVVFDSARQADGKLVNVGSVKRPDGVRKLQVFRLRPDGSLDPDFGLGGQVVVADASGAIETGRSVLVEPDGRIVVAGARGNNLLVVRLQANGALDPTFGNGGAYVSEPGSARSNFLDWPMQIVRTPGGAFRVMASAESVRDCSVLGLTASGTLDVAFGDAGVLGPDNGFACGALAVDAAGRLVLGGTRSGVDGEVRRILANGKVDSQFHTAAIPSRLRAVTALTLGATGSIFVAGFDRSGQPSATVLRLLADGAVDPLYGRAGASTIDLQNWANSPVILDMQALGNGALVVGGGNYYSYPFVARLLGDSAGGGSPGVLGMALPRVIATEQGGQAVLSVRRTGGSAGAVAVTYSTGDTGSATSGTDYTATTGRLTWADGDVGEREIVVPIASDTNLEKPEFFPVRLDSPEGGAGLGSFGADVEIAGASYPVGELTIHAWSISVNEGDEATFAISRNFYSQGTVSVTVRVAAGGSATPGQDFSNAGSKDWQDVVLTWADGEMGWKSLPVQIAADGIAEQQFEDFTLELVSPTGGAALGDSTKATVFINPPPSPPPRSAPVTGGSGGGGFGWLGAVLLGLGGALRRRLTGNRKLSRAGVLS